MNELAASKAPELLIRACANIKSRKSPDIQCKSSATHGDFCSRHWKHPTRFTTGHANVAGCTRRHHAAAKRIQTFWRNRVPYLMYAYHGPGFSYREKSCNETELYSFDPVKDIPKLFYFSYIDARMNLWSFDIRTLGQILSMGELKQNPYTREMLTPYFISRVIRRLTWLRTRKYSVLYPTGVDLTAEQIWRQRVLDLCMKIESFGYYVSCDWYTEMSVDDHKKFYARLYDLWTAGLGLTNEQRESIVPGYKSTDRPLFRYSPEALVSQRARTKSWWDKHNLAVIEALLTRSPIRESNKLGAMYCVIGFVAVNEKAADVFPWFAEV